MKIVYLDCSSGISGDMFLGSFIDAGFKLADLRKELAKLNLKGYRIYSEQTTRHHLEATKLYIEPIGSPKIRKPAEIERIIKKSRLSSDIKIAALGTFKKLCQAEVKIHKTTNVHLHELGHIDTILDIVGACIVVAKWGIEKIYFSKVTMGRGILKGHMILPIPAPATLEILKGIPAKFSDIEFELITPTGAAILSSLGTFVDEPPVLKVTNVGYGAGSRDLASLPNVLRLVVGETVPAYEKDMVTVMETAIDDTVPIVYTYLYESLFKMGALDVYAANILMKKNRPGVLLSVVLPDDKVHAAAEIIFRETGTNGIRYYPANRLKLERYSKDVATPYGKVSVKVSGTASEIYKISPEFESCKSAAFKKNISFSKVYEAAKKAALVLVFTLFAVSRAHADSVFMNDGLEIKGIVVEEYKDRVVISTENGEKTFMKSDVRDIVYDLSEQNLVALADKCMSVGDYQRAHFYYEKAKKANPDYKEAVEGAAYLDGYLLRKESAKKLLHIQWSQDVEDFQRNKIVEHESIMENLRTGVGLVLDDTSDKDIIVKKVESFSPAKEAGVKEGDVIASVWGKLTRYMSAEEIAREFVKPENAEMKLGLDRFISVPEDCLKSSQLAMAFEGTVLKNIDPDSDAYKCGLRDGDLVLLIDGQSIRYTPLKEVNDILKRNKHELKIRRALTLWSKKGV